MMIRKANLRVIEHDIDYFCSEYSLVELFYNIWLNFGQLKMFSSCRDVVLSSNYYNYCLSVGGLEKLDGKLPDFFFLKDQFKKQSVLYVPPSIFASIKQKENYFNFLYDIKQVASCILSKRHLIFDIFYIVKNKQKHDTHQEI